MAQYMQTKPNRHSIVWVLQAISGIVLVVLLVVHMIVQHFAAGELLSYSDVVAYLSNPLVFAAETVLLVSVTFHALAGVRAIALDFGLDESQESRLTRGLWWLGILVVVYGVGLTLYITR